MRVTLYERTLMLLDIIMIPVFILIASILCGIYLLPSMFIARMFVKSGKKFQRSFHD